MANENKISQIQVGSVTYDIHDAAARDDISALSNFFTIRSDQNDNSLNIGASNPVPSGSFSNTLRIGTFTDLIKAKETSSDQTFAYISARKNTETQAYGAFGFERHSDTDNSNTINSVYFRINDDKTREIQVSDPAAWRSALGLGTTAPGTILWSGATYMMADQVVELSHNISTCMTGIVLHWEAYINGSKPNYEHHFNFIPKTFHNGTGVGTFLVTPSMGNVGMKYVYVHDDRIVGNSYNDDALTTSGSAIKVTNNRWVLSQVIAV